MFTTNQLIFAAVSFVVFVIAMVILYRKDKPRHKKHYKGSFWILLGFIAFIALLLWLKTSLKAYN